MEYLKLFEPGILSENPQIVQTIADYKAFAEPLVDAKKGISKKTQEIKNLKTGKAGLKKTIKSKQKAIDEMKKAKKEYKPKDVGAKDAADFLKKYAKKKTKK